MEAIYLLIIFAVLGFVKWFLMRPIDPLDTAKIKPKMKVHKTQNADKAEQATKAEPAKSKQAPDFESSIISSFEPINYDEYDEPTFSRRNVSIFTIDDAVMWFESKIISMFEVVDYSEYESPTFRRRKIAAALLRKERAKAAKQRKSEIGYTETSSPVQNTKRRIAQEFIEFAPVILS